MADKKIDYQIEGLLFLKLKQAGARVGLKFNWQIQGVRCQMAVT
jgi:hypothetical protein